MAGTTLTPSNLASLQAQAPNTFGAQGSVFNGITPNPAPSSTPAPTTVVTSQPAASNVANMQTGLTTLQNGVASQTQNNQNNQRTAQQQAVLNKTAQLTQDYQNKQLDIQATKAAADKANADAKLAAANTISGTNPSGTGLSTGGGEQISPDNAASLNAQGVSTNPTLAQGGTQTDQNNTQITQYNTQLDNAFQQHLSQINSLQNGVFPLTAPQQAILAATQNNLQQAVAAQKLANANYEGGVTAAGIAAGRSRYAPEIEAGNIANAVNVGIQKIADLENNASLTMAKLQDQFQQQDFAEADKSYTELNTYLTQKTDALQKMNDSIAAAAKDVRDYNLKVSEDQQKQLNDAATQDLAVKKYQLDVTNSQFDNSLKASQAKIDNQLKTAQIAKIYSDMSATDISSAASWVKNIQSGVAKLSDVPKGLKDAVSAGLANGSPQGTNGLLTTTKTALDQLNAMVNAPAGITPLQGAEAGAPMGLGGIITGATAGLLGGGTGFTSAVGAKGISSLFGLKGTPIAGSPAADFDAKLKQVTQDVVLPNLTILHGLGRVTDREFQALQSAVTSLSTNESEEQFKTDLKNVTDTVNAKMAELQPAITASNTQTALQNGYTPDQIIQEYSKDPAMSAKIKTAQQAGYSPQEIVQALTNQQ